MLFLYNYLFFVLWLGYFTYWWAVSRNVKAAERTEPDRSRFTRLLLMLCAILLLALPRVPLPFLNDRFLPDSTWCFWLGASLSLAGLLFSVWARERLGKNWSQAVTLKIGHELITTGPYAVARHPIYTGLLLAFLGSVIARGEWRGLLALALLAFALWRKSRLEEKWMREQFGESYEAYMRRVSALVPYLL